MKRIMLDIETVGTGPQAAILSIGAAEFDSERLFYTNVDLQSCFDAGLVADGATVAWWLKQSEQARGALFVDALPLYSALFTFCQWLGFSGAPVECELWAYPASFDLVIVENALRACQMQVPWHYRSPRCLRTLAAVSGVAKPSATPHEACRDAQMQVAWAKACLAALGKS